MVAIPFPVSTFPGRTPQEGAGRLINAHAEAMGEGARAGNVRHRVAGLTGWGTTGEEGFRGALLAGSTLYAAFEGQVVSFSSSGGAASSVDALDGTDKIFWAKNNKRPTPDILIICSAGAFVLSGGSITDLNDVDLPAANAMCFLGGYFFVTIADGRCFASGLNATTFNANDYTTAEAKSDTLLRPIPWNGLLHLFGSGSIEVWDGDNVNATGFPYNRSAVIQRGLAGQRAVAGFEDGFGKGLLFVGDDNAVHRLNGYIPEKVSPPDLDRLIEAVTDKSTLEASVYIAGGHPKWVLSCPAWTWEVNLNTGRWNERKSYEQPRWRGTQSLYAFGKWLCGDTESGNIVEISNAEQDEVGQPLIAEVWSAPVQNFPRRIRCPRADFDFSTAVGAVSGDDPNETDPSVEISYSDDGGYRFSNPRILPLGKRGKPLTRVTAFNNGMSGPQGRIWKLKMSDPRHFGLMAGDMSADVKVT